MKKYDDEDDNNDDKDDEDEDNVDCNLVVNNGSLTECPAHPSSDLRQMIIRFHIEDENNDYFDTEYGVGGCRSEENWGMGYMR